MGVEIEIVEQVLVALESDQLDLPTLPDIALKIRKALDDPNVSADQLVNFLSFDPVISAQIIKASNSAAYSSGQPIISVRQAIVRLGYRTLRNLVMAATLDKLFQVESPHVSRQLKKLWKHSLQVAINSHVLASSQKHLIPEEALLAGLVHDIGALPLYLYADAHCPDLDRHALEEMVARFRSEVGVKLLQHWNFPDETIEVVQRHEDLQRVSDSSRADYVDIVMMANLQMPGAAETTDWENVSAVAKLGFTVEECKNFLSANAEQLAKVNSMFGVDAPKPRRAVAPPEIAPAKPTTFWEKILSFFK